MRSDAPGKGLLSPGIAPGGRPAPAGRAGPSGGARSRRATPSFFLVLLVLLLLPGVLVAPAGAEEGTWLVIRQIAPVMRVPGPYRTVENGRGLRDEGRFEACVYYGSRLTVAPAPGRTGERWVRLRGGGKTLGYVEKNALVPFPAHEKIAPEPFCVRPERLPLYLLPGERPLERYSRFYLPRGVTVNGVGRTRAKGSEWILLRFDSAGGGEAPADLLTRYAWARASDLIRLGDYVPDTTRVREDRIPSVVLTEQDEGMRGSFSLGAPEKRALTARGFRLDPRPLILPELEVDDLVEAYPRTRDHVTPLFLTVDLGLHPFHLIFDRMLQKAEERHFAPALADLLVRMQGALRDLEGRETALASTDRGRAVRAIAEDTLSAALCLLTGRGEALSPRARGEVDRILAAEGRFPSSLSGKEEDYTLYRPRGHYRLSPALERYFRAMSLLGGLTFPLRGRDEETALRNTGTIGLFCALLEDPGVQAAWRRLFDPFTFLVGASNDNSWADYGPVARRLFADLPLGDPERIRAFNRALVAASRPPLIVGGPAPRVGASQAEREEEALGFRLLGRRFTFDAMILNVLTSPRTGSEARPRNLPDPLDVMAVLGSRAAREETRPFLAFDHYGENQKKLIASWRTFEKNPLSRNVYTGLLRLYSDYFEPTGGGQFFARSGAWEYRKLLAASASWAELKHDTILYGEQSGAEMGDGGDVWYAPDFLFPEPRGYVEPEPRVFAGLARASRRCLEFLGKTGFRDEEYSTKFRTFAGLMDRLAAIAEKEAAGRPILREDYRTIREFPAELSRELLLPENLMGLYPPVTEEVRDRMRMALVADVATDHLGGRVLYVATGAPRRLLVFVDDRWGGPRVTRGAVCSFYSFARPLSEGRMDDATWKKRVYGGDPGKLDGLRPAWIGRLKE